MMKLLNAFLVSAMLLGGSILPASAQVDYSTSAPFAILMDHESGTVLYQKDADERLEPASMAKLMTIAVVFEALENGALAWEDEFFISEYAWREGGASSGGSTMFAELNSKVQVQDLVRSVIIQSGNDASIAIAEGMAGNEATFSRLMNVIAEEIGMDNSRFVNATGLPDEFQYSTARDLATLASYLITTYDEHYPIFAEESFTWNKINQSNRNVLINMGIGVDGLKTGHTEASGYGIVASSAQGGRRLIAVLHGMDSSNQRAEEARKLLNWGARAFDLVTTFADGETVGHVDVYGGEVSEVALVGQGEITLYLPIGSKRCLSAQIAYNAPIRPPVLAGDEIAELRVFCEDELIQTAPLFAAHDVADGSITRKAADALKELTLGWL